MLKTFKGEWHILKSDFNVFIILEKEVKDVNEHWNSSKRSKYEVYQIDHIKGEFGLGNQIILFQKFIMAVSSDLVDIEKKPFLLAYVLIIWWLVSLFSFLFWKKVIL